MYSYTDNPVGDFERYSAHQEALLLRLPVCACCMEPIQQERAVCMEGDWYCDRCLDDKRKFTDID